ncbi:MAG: hypothetical protein WBA25_12980 [Jannaschia sp.]
MISPVRAILLPCVLVGSVASAECPAAPDISATMDDLIAGVQAAGNERDARVFSGQMWEQWVRAPDGRAQELLDEGMERRAVFDLPGAIRAFDALVDYCPDYAEGYNQRAFANFLDSDYAAALPDLDRTLALRPRHIAALAGRGLTLISMGRMEEGRAAIREAVTLNPWLTERHLLDLPDPPGGGVDL